MTDELLPRTIGRYQVVGELGRGAMGVVYRGFDPVIGRPVALKMIEAAAVAENAAEFRQRLFHEAAAAGALAHPNIVTIYDVLHESGATAIAMEFIEGETLASIIAARAPLPIDEAVAIIEQVAAGLDYAAARGIVHRDIKPANILVGADGRACIADFGIARLPASSLTMTGAILGSAGYMSPEQVQGLPLDARSDLFSAATVFYEMITGRHPFGGTAAVNAMYRIVHEPPAPLDELPAPAGPAIGAALDRALAKTPARRFATGAEFARALRAAAGGRAPARTTAADLVLRPGRARRGAEATTDSWATQPPLRRLGLLLGAVGLAGAAGLALFLLLRPDRPAAPVPEPAVQPAGPAGGAVPGGSGPPAPGSRATTRRTADSAGGGTVRPAEAAGTPPGAHAPAAGPPAYTPPPSATPPVPTDPAVAAPPPPTTVPPPAVDPPGRTAAAPPTESTPPPSGPTALVVRFEGEPYQVAIFEGDQQLGQLSAAGSIDIEPGTRRVRVVSATVFLDRVYDALVVRPGAPATIAVPALGSVVAGVRGEVYTGVRILLDDRQLPLPYPAQVPRVAAGTHTMRFTWLSGPFAGKDLQLSFAVRGGGHFLVRAVPENDQVVVQQIR